MILNVSFGIFAFLPQGWIFMLFVILLECLLLSKFLTFHGFDKLVYGTVVLSNLISGAIGIVISIILNGGWWLVVWFPWVSNNEVYGIEGFMWLIMYYLLAFILTLIIECLINWIILKKRYDKYQILKGTLRVNVTSYLVGSVILYMFSFGLT